MSNTREERIGMLALLLAGLLGVLIVQIWGGILP